MNQRSRFQSLIAKTRLNVEAAESSPRTTEPAKSQSAPAILAGIAFAQRDLENERDQALREAGATKLISLELIDSSPHQTRDISKEQVNELALNLANNPLSSPVVVRRIGDRFELIAGHHRVEAFKQLGRKEIPSVIQDFNEVEASDALFMDNMIAPNIADYEKYLGLVNYQKNHPDSASMKSLAEKTGFSKSQIERLLSFSKLSKKVLSYIDKNRRVIGANIAYALGGLSDKPDDAILEALALVASGKLKQADLVKHLGKQAVQKASTTKCEAFVINRGDFFYAKVARTKKKLTIETLDEETALQIEQAIHELLETKAKS
jgi:ParB family chromosome partitioning protein